MNKEALFKALSEPSTYAGLSGLALALGISVDGWEAVSAGLAGLFGAIAVFVREKGDKK